MINNNGLGDAEMECKCHDFEEEKLQKARDEWNKKKSEMTLFCL